jgi:hypothetical protein
MYLRFGVRLPREPAHTDKINRDQPASIALKNGGNGVKNLLRRAFNIPFCPFLKRPRIEVLFFA